VDYTSPNGNHYTVRSGSTTYGLDENGRIMSQTAAETYSGPGGLSFTIAADGSISSSENGYVVNGSWNLNSSSSYSGGGGSIILFGSTYTQISGSESASSGAGLTESVRWEWFPRR